MQVRVPQFIEHDPKLLGPFTMSQTIYIGAALFGTFILYVSIGSTNFFLFFVLSGGMFGVALFLAFYKVEGLSISSVIKNSIDFNMKTKLYLWKRRQIPVYLSLEKKKEDKTKAITEQKVTLGKRDTANDISKKIEFRK